jgi:hypothetical protein
MTTLFDGKIHVTDGNLYLQGGEVFPSYDDMSWFNRTDNFKLLWVEKADYVWLWTGIRFGSPPIRFDLLDGPPSDHGGEWERVEEASLNVTDPERWFLTSDSGDARGDFTIPVGVYRVRWNCANFEAGRRQDVETEDGFLPDRYLLEMWPEPEKRDYAVLR